MLQRGGDDRDYLGTVGIPEIPQGNNLGPLSHVYICFSPAAWTCGMVMEREGERGRGREIDMYKYIYIYLIIIIVYNNNNLYIKRCKVVILKK